MVNVYRFTVTGAVGETDYTALEKFYMGKDENLSHGEFISICKNCMQKTFQSVLKDARVNKRVVTREDIYNCFEKEIAKIGFKEIEVETFNVAEIEGHDNIVSEYDRGDDFWLPPDSVNEIVAHNEAIVKELVAKSGEKIDPGVTSLDYIMELLKVGEEDR